MSYILSVLLNTSIHNASTADTKLTIYFDHFKYTNLNILLHNMRNVPNDFKNILISNLLISKVSVL